MKKSINIFFVVILFLFVACSQKQQITSFSYQLINQEDELAVRFSESTMHDLSITVDKAGDKQLMKWKSSSADYYLFQNGKHSSLSIYSLHGSTKLEGAEMKEVLDSLYIPAYTVDSKDGESFVLNRACELVQTHRDETSTNFVECSKEFSNRLPVFGDIPGIPLSISFWACEKDVHYSAVQESYPGSDVFNLPVVSEGNKMRAEQYLSIAQLHLYGKVRNTETKQGIGFGRMEVMNDGSLDTLLVFDCDGSYDISLAVGHLYELIFKGGKLVPKIVRMDLTEIPDSAGLFEVMLDGNLFEPTTGVDYTFMKQPMILAGYDKTLDEIVFDMEYSKKMTDTLKIQMGVK